jgi:hypothetical protein
MRRWRMQLAPRDGTPIVACTRVEGVEHNVRWTTAGRGGWIDAVSGTLLPSDIFVEWRRCDGGSDLPR